MGLLVGPPIIGAVAEASDLGIALGVAAALLLAVAVTARTALFEPQRASSDSGVGSALTSRQCD